MRIHPVCQGKLRAQVALELRNSFNLWQNLQIHSFLVSLSLLCNLVFLLLCVEDLALLMPGLAQLLLLEVSVSQVFGDFNIADINFCRGGNDKLLVCSAQRNSVDDKRPYRKNTNLNKNIKQLRFGPGMVAHACNFSREEGRSRV